jgi:hypothetical protein
MFRAIIELPDGAVATGWGVERRSQESEDLNHLVTAENRAIVRALYLLGFGTQYASEYDAVVEVTAPNAQPLTPVEERPAPAPVKPPRSESAETRQSRAKLVEPAAPVAVAELKADYEVAAEEEGEAEDTHPEPTQPPEPLKLRTRPEPNPVETLDKGQSPSIENPVVDERLKYLTDEALRLWIKQIYYEARKRFNLNEDRVDERSRKQYSVPAYELDEEQAREFLERIRQAAPRKTS